MRSSDEALSAKLKIELGAGAIERDPRALAAYAVDGKIPSVICFPSTPEQVSSLLRICAESEAAVAPWGGGTSMSLGNIPRQVDVVIGLERMAELIEHDDANLTATVQAGMRIASFQKLLGQRRQFLPVDPPEPLRATIGGMVAANVHGPRRMMYGSLRDLVVGMKIVLATGERIKAGGKVVKNVAGYDLCKLFVGSLGTLGIITEVTFRVSPLPESRASFFVSGPLERCSVFVEKLSGSPLLPAAVAVISSGVTQIAGQDRQAVSVLAWLEGFEESVARHLHDLEQIAKQIGLPYDVAQNERHQRLWEEVENFGMKDEGLLYHLTVPADSVDEVLAGIEDRRMSERSIRYIAYPSTGTVRLLTDADPSATEAFPRLMLLARRHRGHATMVCAPAALKESVDVWGEPPKTLSIMRKIKQEFDPQGILNPGRFLAGL